MSGDSGRLPDYLVKDGGESAVDCATFPSSRQRDELRSAFQQDAIKAWGAYQATGLHATFEEADAWMAKLQAGKDVEPPEGRTTAPAHGRAVTPPLCG